MDVLGTNGVCVGGGGLSNLALNTCQAELINRDEDLARAIRIRVFQKSP